MDAPTDADNAPQSTSSPPRHSHLSNVQSFLGAQWENTENIIINIAVASAAAAVSHNININMMNLGAAQMSRILKGEENTN